MGMDSKGPGARWGSTLGVMKSSSESLLLATISIIVALGTTCWRECTLCPDLAPELAPSVGFTLALLRTSRGERPCMQI